MTRTQLQFLKPGDRVRSRKRLGVVVAVGMGVGGLYFVQVEWDGLEGYSRYTRYSADWTHSGEGVRRLHRLES